MFREIVENSITSRGLIQDVGNIHTLPSDYPRYMSMFMFGKDMEAHIKVNRSVKDFKGKIYADAVWIDIDAENNLEGAKNSCIDLIRRLNVDYQINPDHLAIFFSGNKGFHLMLHFALMGFLPSDAVTPDKVKDFVRRLCDGIPHVDLAIYEPVRIFRIENSRHEKSGLYKIRISFDELQCEAESIRLLAQKPRKFVFTGDTSGFGKNERLAALWLNSGIYVQEQAAAAESKGNLFEPPAQGSRNKTLLVQACTLFRKSELSKYAVQDIVWNAAQLSNVGASDNVTFDEVKRIIVNAERLVGDERKKAKTEELNIKSFGEWIPEWEAQVLQEQTNMTMCFPDINRILHGKLKGKLGVLMGKGGSKKSLYALQVLLRNLKENGDTGIYSTMEMSAPQLINRVIDHDVNPQGFNQNASTVLEGMYRRDLNEGRKFLYDLAKAYGNKLQIISNSRMTHESYQLGIQKVTETTGKPSILIADGLSMMGGKGSETEVYSQNSADLKELAKDENIFILLICHLSKEAEKDLRDGSRFVRGSEKILDNCDFYMTMSQVREDDNMELFNPNKGFIHFYDKRGSGQTANMVFDFDPRRLQLNPSLDDPKQYMESRSKKNKYQESDF